MKKEDPQIADKNREHLSFASEQKALFDLLIQAIKQDDRDLFYSCLSDNANMAHYRGSDGQTPLHVACEF